MLNCHEHAVQGQQPGIFWIKTECCEINILTRGKSCSAIFSSKRSIEIPFFLIISIAWPRVVLTMAASWISLPSSGTAAESFSMPSSWTASSSSEPSESSAIAATAWDFKSWTVIYTSDFNIPLAASESLTFLLGCRKKKDINIWMLVESRIV